MHSQILASEIIVLFGAEHLGALALTVLIAAAMIVAARKISPQPKSLKIGVEFLAWTLLLSHPTKVIARLALDVPLEGDVWPMHLCNWAAVIGFLALRYRHPLMCELLYFWGLAFTFQALLTPSITWQFPHPLFIIFFLVHSGIVVAAVYIVFGAGIIPRPGAVWRSWLLVQVYVICASLTNVLTQSNYGFLHKKPTGASLLDHLGPWPYYIIALEIISLAIFALLNLPFLISRLRRPPKLPLQDPNPVELT